MAYNLTKSELYVLTDKKLAIIFSHVRKGNLLKRALKISHNPQRFYILYHRN